MLADLPGNALTDRAWPKPRPSSRPGPIVKNAAEKPVYRKVKDNGPIDWAGLQKQIVDILLRGPHTSGDLIDLLDLKGNRKGKQAVYNIVSLLVKQKHAVRAENGMLTLPRRVNAGINPGRPRCAPLIFPHDSR